MLSGFNLAVVETAERNAQTVATTVQTRTERVPVAKRVRPGGHTTAHETEAVGAETAPATSAFPTTEYPSGETQTTEAPKLLLLVVHLALGSFGGGLRRARG
jgi:hypothetical protein